MPGERHIFEYIYYLERMADISRMPMMIYSYYASHTLIVAASTGHTRGRALPFTNLIYSL